MQEYELSFLYLPPKDWPLRAEDWHDQVDKIIKYTRQTVAKEMEACGAGLVGLAGIPAILNIREAADLFASIARGENE